MVKIVRVRDVSTVDPRIPIPRSHALIVWRKYYIRYNLSKGRLVHKQVRTICEVIRELYEDAIKRGDALAMTKCEEATDMAKRMQFRLVEINAKRGDSYLVKDGVAMKWLTKNEFKVEEKKPRSE